MARKPIYPWTKRKFFLVGSTGAGASYWTFLVDARGMVTATPVKAKRFYSKSVAQAFLKKILPSINPYMTHAVLNAVEDSSGIKVYAPSSKDLVELDMRDFLSHAKDPRLSAYKKNPSKGFRERSDRLHKMRAKALASLKKLMRSGNTKEAEKLRARIMRIDRMIYRV